MTLKSISNLISILAFKFLNGKAQASKFSFVHVRVKTLDLAISLCSRTLTVKSEKGLVTFCRCDSYLDINYT